MKKLFRFLSLALCTICLTMTAVFAGYDFPKYESPEQFMDPEFALQFAKDLQKHNRQECTHEAGGFNLDGFYGVKCNIRRLLLDLARKNPKACLRLIIAICQIFPHKGHADVYKPEQYSSANMDKLDPENRHKTFRLRLKGTDKETGKGLLTIAYIEYDIPDSFYE